jgi:NAD(P)-dependent dehydrogenase (short-subunit alcohol dehydrogenase family)
MLAACGLRISLNAVAPGTIDTETLNRVAVDDKQFLETLKSMHPTGRIGDPEEIANAVVWLLSDKASFVLSQLTGRWSVDESFPTLAIEFSSD